MKGLKSSNCRSLRAPEVRASEVRGQKSEPQKSEPQPPSPKLRRGEELQKPEVRTESVQVVKTVEIVKTVKVVEDYLSTVPLRRGSGSATGQKFVKMFEIVEDYLSPVHPALRDSLEHTESQRLLGNKTKFYSPPPNLPRQGGGIWKVIAQPPRGGGRRWEQDRMLARSLEMTLY